ncbi:MAG: NAD-dependent epimerase/dehydratase family protein [Deltaproteobacteria bacterium]|nr:NAD-dependent epimerase/dehydratase family protein [Deltaproteobacteria bacterium]
MASVVAITGGTGFMGSYATLLFESLGHRVYPVDLLPPSHDLSLLPIKVKNNRLDVTDSRAFGKLCKSKKVTHIVHLAHPRGEEEPDVLHRSHQAMTSVLEAAKNIGVERVVFASSASIYGLNKKRGRSLAREDDPVGMEPVFLHRTSKIMGEWLGAFYAQQYGLNFVALRFSSVYGPGQSGGLGTAIKEGIMGRECEPSLSRDPDDPIFVKDAVQALRLACFSDQIRSRVYNIGCGKSYVESDLERAMQRHMPEVSFAVQKPPVSKTIEDLPHSNILDVSLARDELGFVPQFDLETGVGAIASWARNEKRRLK